MKLRIKGILKRIFKIYIAFMAISASLFVILSFTDIPYMAYHSLSLTEQKIGNDIDAIVLMGGGGMPSPAGLMRLHYSSKLASKYAEASIVLAIPIYVYDSVGFRNELIDELGQNGISRERIIFEHNGYNTRTQALAVSKIISKDEKIVIVSSPEHMFRAVRSFEKVGFKYVSSYPAFEIPSDESELLSKKKEVDKVEVQNLSLRYNMWSYMQYEIRVLREYFAIIYYWLKGWI